MKMSFLVSIVMLILSCQNSSDTFRLNKNQYQKFKIICDRDTILESIKGVSIKITSNTFECVNDKNIEIGFAAILDKSDMITNELYTVTKNGELLESGGMFQIIDLTNNSKNFKKPIQLEIPTATANPNMSKYLLDKSNDLLTWFETEEQIGLQNNEGINTGAKLFKNHCTNCHNSNLRYDLTGPALGNVHLFRDKDWLIEFTRNSQKMIGDGDSLSLCLYNEWNKQLMNSFPTFTDKEIKNIYEYIANESRLQGIGRYEVEYITECEILNNFEYTVDTIKVYKPLKGYDYLTSLFGSNWINVDDLLNTNSEIDPIIINLDIKYPDLSLVLVFQERNTVIPFVQDLRNDRRYHLLMAGRKEKIKFPLGEKINIVAYDSSDNFRYVIKEYQTKKINNNIDLSLGNGKKEDFLELLKDL